MTGAPLDAGGGAGGTRRLVASAAVAASAVAYFAGSAFLGNEAAVWSYRDFLFTLADRAAVRRVIDGVVADIRPAGLAATALFVVVCHLAGVAAARLASGTRADGPERLLWASMAAVLPALLLATIGWPDGRGMLRSAPMIGLAALLAVAAALTHRRRSGSTADTLDQTVQPRGPDVPRWWVLPPAVALVLLAAAVVIGGVTTVQGFDSLGYHLPMAGRWLARGRLVTGVEAAMNLFYPGNFELLLRWALAAGGDHAAWLPSFASAAGCLYLLYRIGLEIGQPRRVAIVAAMAAASVPLVARLAGSAYSDLFMAMMLLLAVWALLRWIRTGTSRTGLLATMGGALGLAIGTKYSALPPAAMLVAAWGWHAFMSAPVRRDASGVEHVRWRWIARQAGVIAGVALAGCGYWYLRNAIEHGNPLFPVSVAGLPGVRMDYLIPRVPALAEPGWRWAAYPWGDFELRNVVEGGLGPTFAVAAVIGFVLAPFDRAARGGGRGVVWVLTLGSLLLWLTTKNVVPRYGLFPLLLAFVFVGELWVSSGTRVVRAVTVACITVSMLLTARAIVTDAIYVASTGRSLFLGLRPLVDAIAPSRILNAVGTDIAAPANYELLGSDYRHDVITTYADALPADVLRYGAHYVLLQDSAVARFARVVALVPAGRVAAPDTPPVSLWRVVGPRR